MNNPPPTPPVRGTQDPPVSRLVTGMVILGVIALLGQAFTLWALLGFQKEKSYWEGQEENRSQLTASVEALQDKERTARDDADRALLKQEEAERERLEAQAKAELHKQDRDQALDSLAEAMKGMREAKGSEAAAKVEEARLRELSSRLEASLPGLREEVSQLEQEEDALTGHLQSLRKSIGTRGAELESRGVEVRDQEARRSSLADEVNALSKEAAEARALIDQKRRLVSDIEGLDTTLELRRAARDRLTSEIAEKTQIRDQLAKLQAKEELLLKQTVKLESDKRELESYKKELEVAIDPLDSVRLGLRAEISRLKGDVEDLESEAAVMAVLQSNISALANQERELNARIEVAIQKFTRHTQEEAELEGRMDALRSEARDLGEIETTLRVARESVNSLKVQKRRLTAEAQSLESTIQDRENERAELEGQLRTLDREAKRTVPSDEQLAKFARELGEFVDVVRSLLESTSQKPSDIEPPSSGEAAGGEGR